MPTPYDPQKVKNILALRANYGSTPYGEWLSEEVFPQIEAMQEEIRQSATRIAKAESERNAAEEQRDQAIATARKLRDGNSGMGELVATLQTIARQPKGASKLAKDALAKLEGAKV